MQLQDQYKRWLIEEFTEAHKCEYIFLMTRLFNKEYYYIIPEDENRMKDGLYLRYIFSTRVGLTDDNVLILNELLGPCRVLEMLIALSDRMWPQISQKKTGIDRLELFWIMIKNLTLNDFDDCSIVSIADPIGEIDDILNNLLDGHINLFKMKQRIKNIQLTDQFNTWVREEKLW